MNSRQINTLIGIYIILSNFEVIIDAKTADKPKLLVISFDGFRYDYFDAYQPSNFVKFAKSGVRLKYGMTASFPTRTFPNHYTLATGLYPESHGIVDNSFYDEQFNENFTAAKKETKWFEDGEPIWITGRLQGLTTAAYFWFGSETIIKGTTANFYVNYDKSIPWPKRIDKIIQWLENENVSVLNMYFEEPDSAGHKCGGLSECVRIQVQKLDDTLGTILQKLEEKNLRKNMNIILLSDHGMTNVSQTPSENLILNDVVSEEDVKMVFEPGPVTGIYPQEGKATTLRDKLNKVTKNVKVYFKEDIPKRLHYFNNRRIAPLVAIANEGFQTMLTKKDLADWGLGNHGYDNSLRSMRPFFMASGPSFKADVVFDKTFENVNIYPLMCHLLNLKPSANNGSIENVLFMLKSGITKVNENLNLFFVCFLIVSFSRFYH